MELLSIDVTNIKQQSTIKLIINLKYSSRLNNRTVQYSTVQYSTVQYSTVQHSTIQYSTVHYSTVHYSTVQYSTVQYSTVHYSTPQYSTAVRYLSCSPVQNSAPCNAALLTILHVRTYVPS